MNLPRLIHHLQETHGGQIPAIESSLGLFLFAYLLLAKIEQDLHLNRRVTNFALLVMATFPFLVLPPMFEHQDMAAFLLMAIFYLLYKQFIVRSASYSVLLIVFICALIVSSCSVFVSLILPYSRQ